MLRSGLALRCCLVLLRGCLTLLRSRLPLLRCSLALLWLRGCLPLLWSSLTLLLLWGCLTLLRCSLMLLRGCLPLLWSSLVLLWNSLVLLRSSLMLLLNRLMLLLLRGDLALLLLRSNLIACLHRRGSPHVAICRKRLTDGKAGWPAMIDARKLSPVGAGSALILHLRPHGRGMLFMQCRHFRRPGSHLHSARSAVEAHAGAAAVVLADRAAVDVVHHGNVDVVD